MTNANYFTFLSQPNVLINNEASPRACISDFGFSTVAPSISFDPTTYKADCGGTFGYMAPELFAASAKPSKEADMYAFGMVVYEVVTGARPFGQRRAVELLLPTIVGTRPSRPENPMAVGFGQGTWELAEKCWDRDRGRRPTAREALEHFGCVAKTSRVVGPGPTIPGYGTTVEAPSKLESSSQSYGEFHGPSTISPSDGTPSQIIRPSVYTQLEQTPTNNSHRTCAGFESESPCSVPPGR